MSRENLYDDAAKTKAAAQQAAESAAPADGKSYSYLMRLHDAIKSAVSYSPFQHEITRARIVAYISIVALVVGLYVLGWSRASLFLTFFLGAAIGVGLNDGFFKKYPVEVNKGSISTSKIQLKEAGEDGQKNQPTIMHVVLFSLVTADGLIFGTAIFSFVSALTPKVALILGGVFAATVTCALYFLLHVVVRESCKNEARARIRALTVQDPAAAKTMIARVGGALKNQYGVDANTKLPLIGLVSFTFIIAAAQVVLRLAAAHAEDPNSLNIGTLVGALAMSVTILFTVLAAFFIERRTCTIDRESSHSLMILSKFPDEATLDRYLNDHGAETTRRIEASAALFISEFNAYKAKHFTALTHPTPVF